MRKNRKGFNWRARSQAEVVIQQGPSVAIEIKPGQRNQINGGEASIGADDGGSVDGSNCLVLPSTKRKTVKKTDHVSKAKFVSRRQKKMQDRLKEKRIKSAKRGDLIKAIQAVQATEEEMKQFTTITQMQTTGLKRHFRNIKRAEQDAKRPKLDSPTNTSSAVVDVSAELSHSDSSDEDDYSSSQFPVIHSSPFPSARPIKVDPIEAPESAKEKARRRSPSPSLEALPSKPIVQNPFRKVHNVVIQRPEEVQLNRAKLPVTSEEQTIMEAINENPIVVVCGETGSGKTTQIPQFLYEAGYASGDGIIGVTEPRRVAAISMSQRIGLEMDRPREVSYQIRYEGNVNKDTKIKLMTDGVLTRELASDFLLTKYSVIVIDEAHERSVYTDVLIGLLSRIVPLREKRGLPLKLIIMSATLRVEDFVANQNLFPTPPPVIKIDSRQYPVTIHFNKRTPNESEYLEEAYKKACKIHRELPDGGILIFVTGQQEVQALCSRLRETFPFRPNQTVVEGDTSGRDESRANRRKRFKLDDYAIQAIDEEEGEAASDAEFDVEEDKADQVSSRQPMFVLPLFSLLPSAKQALVFQPPPAGCRLCVVATNVAETSLTIPDVKYVVDTGKTKTKLYDRNTGLSTFRIMWNSKAASNQRAGRAGRTSAGHCYRLFSSAVFNDEFAQFTPPEITRRPIEDLVLQMKAMNIEKVVNFPFPSPPSRESLIVAEAELLALGAVQPVKGKTLASGSRITPLGRTMSNFPVAPRFAKMLALSGQHDLMPYMISLVAALTVQEPFLEGKPEDDNQELPEDAKQRQAYFSQLKKRWIGQGFSKMLGDLMVLLKAIGAAEFAGLTPEYCAEHCLRFKAMKEIRQLRQQLTNSVLLAVPNLELSLDPNLSPPTELQSKLLIQVVLSCMGGKIARRIPASVIAAANVEDKSKLRHAYQTLSLEQLVYIHPSSVLFQDEPEFILYQELFEGNKIYCRNVLELKGAWIPKFAPQHCIFSAPLEEPEARFDGGNGNVICHRTSTCGPHGWPLPSVEVDYPEGVELYKWFGRFFLEGLVCPKLQPFAVHLLIKPNVMIKTWAEVHPATQTLLHALVQRKVATRAKLLQVWSQDQSYLMQEYLQWLPQNYRTQAAAIWPPN
ncbi:putative ATP-dependent RNA helicase DHX37 [Hypsibius exemplaris]|uniref:RNA helicase n=1 Tax=Hypsibius exemplaris TaxID=2072580 RepID=A0A1W0X8Q9_HYPEX|nr:putative ATP-dependent RNA helicase DHX37 [Hypsibius exemplaris]